MEKTCATTVAIDVKHENGNVWTGKILKGTIRLKGPLATPELIASIAENPKREVNDFYKMTYVGQRFSDDVSDRVYYKGNMCLAVYETADIIMEHSDDSETDTLEEGTTAFETAILREIPETRKPILYILVLESTGVQSGQYRRVGLAESDKNTFTWKLREEPL